MDATPHSTHGDDVEDSLCRSTKWDVTPNSIATSTTCGALARHHRPARRQPTALLHAVTLECGDRVGYIRQVSYCVGNDTGIV